MSGYRHLDLSERIRIESKLTHHHCVSGIARALHRDPKTIRDEILRNRNSFLRGSYGKGANPCEHRESCEHVAGDICEGCLKVGSNRLCRYCGECSKDNKCPTFKEEICPLLNQTPFVCNGCKRQSVCRLRHYVYRAELAQIKAENRAKDSRTGISVTLEELRRINDVVTPGLRAGQSLNHILVHNKDDIPCSVRTIYAYIDLGLLDAKNLDLPEKVTRKLPRKKPDHKVDPLCYQNRTHVDYLKYQDENPHLSVVQMDCIQGLMGESKTILNLYLPQFRVCIPRLLLRQTARQVCEQLEEIRDLLGQELFDQIFAIILTDRGSEFSDPSAIEALGNIRVFYCDPLRSDQKGAVERANREIRRIIPKGYSMQKLEQEDVMRLSSHLNSYSCPSLGNKSPYELFALSFTEEPLRALGIERISPNEIILSPKLLHGKVTRKDS